MSLKRKKKPRDLFIQRKRTGKIACRIRTRRQGIQTWEKPTKSLNQKNLSLTTIQVREIKTTKCITLMVGVAEII